MRDVEMRKRMERLLQGAFNPDDLNRIFLFLRSRSYGKDAVREVGDFVAHSDERQKGVVTSTARGFFASVRLHFVLITHKQLNLSNVPSTFPLALQTTLNLIEEEKLRDATGINRKRAKLALSSVMPKFARNVDGTYSLKKPLDAQETTVVSFLAGTLVAKTAFTDDMLVKDLWSVLEKNQIGKIRGESRLCTAKASYCPFHHRPYAWVQGCP